MYFTKVSLARDTLHLIQYIHRRDSVQHLEGILHDCIHVYLFTSRIKAIVTQNKYDIS